MKGRLFDRDKKKSKRVSNKRVLTEGKIFIECSKQFNMILVNSF